MPSLTTVDLDKKYAFRFKKTVHTKSSSSSSPSFLDITPALQYYLDAFVCCTILSLPSSTLSLPITLPPNAFPTNTPLTLLHTHPVNRKSQRTLRRLQHLRHVLLQTLRQLHLLTRGPLLDKSEELRKHPHAQIIRNQVARRHGRQLLLRGRLTHQRLAHAIPRIKQQLIEEIVQKTEVFVAVNVLLVILRARVLTITLSMNHNGTVTRDGQTTHLAEHRFLQLLLHTPLHILLGPGGLLLLQSTTHSLPVHRIAANVLQFPFQLI